VKLTVEWSRLVPLKDGAGQNMIYTVDLGKLQTSSGLYIFGRRYGKQFEALYVGKVTRIRGRVKGQLNNLRLMQHLKNAKAGRRFVLCCRLVAKPGQQMEKCLLLIERALIRHFLSEGHDLVNKQGARLLRHEINSSGRNPKRLIPKLMYVERGK
jgi:hypothetical protein